MVNARNMGGVEIIRPQLLFYISDKQQSETANDTRPRDAAALPAIAGVLKITDGTIRTVNIKGDEKIFYYEN